MLGDEGSETVALEDLNLTQEITRESGWRTHWMEITRESGWLMEINCTAVMST
jgi:hypothetical protein